MGKDGLKMKGSTIEDIDRAAKKLIVKSGDGVGSTFRQSDHAATDGEKTFITRKTPARKSVTFSQKVRSGWEGWDML